MNNLIKLNDPVLGFVINGDTIDCLALNTLYRIKDNKIEKCEKVFNKDGLARILVENEKQIIISNYIDLCIFNKEDFSLIKTINLGTGLSSDICGLYADDKYAYCSIRNGTIARVNLNTFDVFTKKVHQESSWKIVGYKDYIISGTVDGCVLKLEKETLEIVQEIKIAIFNIRSFYIEDGILYAACQDSKIFKINVESFELLAKKHGIHLKMYDIAGIYNNKIITVSHPANQVSFVNKDTLEKLFTLDVNLKLSGVSVIEKDKLYISSRNIQGINYIDLMNVQIKDA